MDNTMLNETQIATLRSSGLLQEGEFAYKAGDLIVAENPVSGEKRVVGPAAAILVENNKRILKG